MNKKLVEQLSNFFSFQPIIKAYIFGSYARGTMNKNSDLDILVDLEKGVGLFQFVKMKLQLEELLNKNIDLVSSNGLSPYIGPEIMKEKILIYEKI
ncbi:MAG: hypothetical protein A2033_13305 [Bacteroidetes bacterium GWA2_31_9]|nr:MAG: hypothetical protein A2033_13305 [Bacteroidetes bacterium GWA2_31_9]